MCLLFCILAYVGSYDSVMAKDAKFAIYARSLAMYAHLGLPGASLSDEIKDWTCSINLLSTGALGKRELDIREWLVTLLIRQLAATWHSQKSNLRGKLASINS